MHEIILHDHILNCFRGSARVDDLGLTIPRRTSLARYRLFLKIISSFEFLRRVSVFDYVFQTYLFDTLEKQLSRLKADVYTGSVE